MDDIVLNDQNAQLQKRRHKLSEEYTRPYFDRFLDNYKHYFLRLIDEAVAEDPNGYPFYSQMSLPISYQIVETILPRMFGRMMNFSISTEEANDMADEQALQNLIKYQMNHPYLIDDPIFARLVGAAKETFITGNAWGTVPWYMKEVEVSEWQPYHSGMGLDTPDWNNLEKIKYYGQQPQWGLVKVKKRVIDAPVFEHRGIFHVFPDPKKKRLSQLGYLIFEDFKSKDEIMDIVNMSPRDYKNIDVFQQMKPAGKNGNVNNSYDVELAGIFNASDFTDRDTDEPQFKIWFVQEPDKLSIVIDEVLTIRESDNPNGDGKIGAMLMKDIIIPGELYAWGEPDPIKRIEDAMTDQANMRNDSVFYDLMRMWKLDPSSLVDGEEFIPAPGTILQMTDLNGLQPIDTGSTKASAYREYEEWNQVIQNVSGVSDYATGQNDKSMNKTLGGIELLQQAANARFQLKLQLFEQLGLKAMGTMYVQRNIRFFDTPQPIALGKEKTVVTPDQIRRIRGNVHFIVDAGSTEAISQSTEQTKWQAIINQIGKPPFDNLTPEGLNEIGLGMLYALRIPNADQIMQKIQGQAGQPAGQNGGFTQQQLQTIMQLLQQTMQKTAQASAQKAKESVSIAYKDAPPDIQRQMEAAAGFTPSSAGMPATVTPSSATPTAPGVPDVTQQATDTTAQQTQPIAQ